MPVVPVVPVVPVETGPATASFGDEAAVYQRFRGKDDLIIADIGDDTLRPVLLGLIQRMLNLAE